MAGRAGSNGVRRCGIRASRSPPPGSPSASAHSCASSTSARNASRSGMAPSATVMASAISVRTAWRAVCPVAMRSRTTVGLSWGSASMLSASMRTWVGPRPVWCAVTVAAACSQWAAATAAAVGSTSVNSRVSPNGLSARISSAAATWMGEASARVNAMAWRARPTRSPRSACSTASSSAETSARIRSVRSWLPIGWRARPTRCAASSTTT